MLYFSVNPTTHTITPTSEA